MSHACAQSPVSKCPLCQGDNGCRLATSDTRTERCWCEAAEIPDDLLRRIPSADLRRVCVCARCVGEFNRKRAYFPTAVAGEYYLDPEGRMVFTEVYHRRRGYCCGNGCRHCPYSPLPEGRTS